MRPVFQASTEMLAAMSKDSRKKYPWHTLKLHESFAVEKSEVKLDNLKAYASRIGKKVGKVFKVIDHGEDSDYEVGFVALRKEKPVAAKPAEPAIVNVWAQLKADEEVALAKIIENN